MPFVVVLPHYKDTLESLQELLINILQEEAKELKVFPVPTDEHVQVSLSTGETSSKRFTHRLGKNQMAQFDQIVLGLLKTHGPIGSMRLQKLVPHEWKHSAAGLRGSLKRLKAEGLIESKGKKRACLYWAV